MTSFSNLLSSIGDKSQAPSPHSTTRRPIPPPTRKPDSVSDRFKLTPSNTVAGMKRKSEEPDSPPKSKAVKIDPGIVASRPASAPGSRFQLSAKPRLGEKSSPLPQRPSSVTSVSANPQRPAPKPVLQSTSGSSRPVSPVTRNGTASAKRGFASILEKAKAAQVASQASSSGVIKHKPVEKLTRKERLKMMEEQKAQQKLQHKAMKKGPGAPGSHREKVNILEATSSAKKMPNTNYRGTMKKPAPELLYRGTMRAEGLGQASAKSKQKGKAQDKYGGYASWSDLDDAEDEEEDYDSEGSDDMEGGFDDVEAEEVAALRAAKKEDQAALEEEDRLRREKLERKRKLEQLSKTAAARKRF